MNFNSISFAVFMGIVFFIYWNIPNKFRWIVLLAASTYFYIGFGIQFFILLCIVTVFSYMSGLMMRKDKKDGMRKTIVIGAITAIICVLAYFKYIGFLVQNINMILRGITIQLSPTVQAIALPVGISFYSFKALSYVIDVYRGQEPETNLGKYAAYMFFFPEIASGPIDRAGSLIPQLTGEHQFSYDKVSYGLKLVAWGLFKKIIVADTLAFFVDWVFDSYLLFRGFSLLLISVFYTIQIYCDFSGYSDMTVGLAKMLDIEVIANFKSPYFSVSVQEFWRRWHISLSTWFRDYLYIPMGGNRKGEGRKNINLLITFLISGLWHGANWTFVFWGGLHGMAQILENVSERLLPRKNQYRKWEQSLKTMLVFTFCSFAWIFFRADTMGQAWYFLEHMFDGLLQPVSYFAKSQKELAIDVYLFSKITVMILMVFIFDWFNKKTDIIELLGKQRTVVRWGIYSIFVFLMIAFLPVTPGTDFLYFKF